MQDLCRFALKPVAFILRYVRGRWAGHAVVLGAVLAAVGCSVSTQYGVKFLVDALSGGSPSTDPTDNPAIWLAVLILVTLIAADNLLWRLASFVANGTFVAVSGDLRRELFRHLTGHGMSYFADRTPGILTSRVTATSNAVFTIENMFVWNVLPPCAATVCAIVLVLTVSAPMAAGLTVISGAVVCILFRWAAAGKTLHHDFAREAATVDGEMVDVIGNLPIVKAFCGISREHHRFDATVEREITARWRSLRYLEALRLFHAITTVTLAVGVLAWAIILWQQGAATTGDVVLLCMLGLSVLHATRDLAIALVDVTQHLARLSEALATLLQPHELRDHPKATPLVRRGASVAFEGVGFGYPPHHAALFENLNLYIAPGQRVGLIGRSGGGKSTLFALLQRFYDVRAGRILIDGQDIAAVTQDSLRETISVVPQDISLFHRSLMENIRYSRPESSDADVIAAAEAAQCDFIGGLPDGFSTLVGNRGTKLSGGQRQRIAIARAFLKNAPILLLDEAASALDGASEAGLRRAMERLVQGRTVIAITHRIASLRDFDRIVAMEAGRIIEDGRPRDVIGRNGPCRELWLSEAITAAS
jgi:ATP-binding cassette subfamily B protein